MLTLVRVQNVEGTKFNLPRSHGFWHLMLHIHLCWNFSYSAFLVFLVGIQKLILSRRSGEHVLLFSDFMNKRPIDRKFGVTRGLVKTLLIEIK